MSYWVDRQKQLYEAMEKDEIKLQKRLSSFYNAEEKRLEKEIASFYKRYGENNIIEYRKLLERLPDSEIQLLMQNMDSFAQKYPQYAHLLPVRANMYKLDRLEGLQYTVMLQQLEIGAKNNDEITKHLQKQAHRGVNAAMNEMGFGSNFYAIDSDKVKSFVNVPWSNGSNFSSRIWANSSKLANYLNVDIAQGFARGDSYEKLTRQVCERFKHVTRKDAYRLIYTEGTYIMAESAIRPFENNYEKYRISTVGDGKVCSICSGMTGEFNITDRKPGINFPPFHPWCRCTFEIVVDDWDKWMDDYVAKHGEQNTEKVLNNLSENDKINHIVNDEVNNVHYIGKLNKDIYKCITDDITTDEVIITDERISHIKDRHPNDFERYCKYMEDIISSPEYIIEAIKPNTAVILKSFSNGDEQFKTILRLVTSVDNSNFKNSIITFMKINNKEWKRLINNKNILYKYK